ncbi:uncharacterized protein MELLADRAFT_85091 [Melampsora larici-populina 98AG31]|uniref:Zn(2)-C6 fungal-type domain-containing protein n=1 Tax=Melampsora larici-populina (strain 98AG31 / pathotype 3-4-7) TaxID=747676 RepID=F4SCT2_MELLP|nr:uncharacterized protein MELLADRAFT_85091 [Melampsora larici-populina 98AG31]EGF97547.1 hypothetical protein MELLADRAFT_85091 [Melampsora larici-populina 98AG31]
MRAPPIHPQSCVECLNESRSCTWMVHESLPITSDGRCNQCHRDKLTCVWPTTYENLSDEIQVHPPSTTYVRGPEFESAAARLKRVKAWTCAPSRPEPADLEFWKADLRLWNNGGNAPLPPQVPVKPKASTSAPQPRPPPIPTQPRAFYTNPKSKPSPAFMPKVPTAAPPPKPAPTPAPPKVSTPEPSTPPPESPPAIPPTTMVDLIETPPSSPTPPQPPSPPAIPSHFNSTFNFDEPSASTSTSVPPEPQLRPPSRNPNDRTHIEDFNGIFGKDLSAKIWFARAIDEADKLNELGGTPHHVDPRDPTIALTEAMFSLLTTHWNIWKSYNPDECLARKILTNQLKNLVAQDMLYCLSGAKHIRPAHYDFPPVDNPDLTPSSSSHPPEFYDSIASGNQNSRDQG